MKIIEAKTIAHLVSELVINSNLCVTSDIIPALEKAKEQETNLVSDALDIIIENHSTARTIGLPICQDTGLAVFFVEIGNDINIVNGSLNGAINMGVKDGYEKGYLRKSVVIDPLYNRSNTNDNLPAIIHTTYTTGDKLRITFMAKGGGSENMSTLKMMKPSAGEQGVFDFVLDTVINAGANPCPPILVGVGIGGDFELCAQMAKRSLLRKIGERNANSNYSQLEVRLLEEINKRGCGVQGFGGNTTALDVFIEYFPCHIASMPVAVNIQCHASRHGVIEL